MNIKYPKYVVLFVDDAGNSCELNYSARFYTRELARDYIEQRIANGFNRKQYAIGEVSITLIGR